MRSARLGTSSITRYYLPIPAWGGRRGDGMSTARSSSPKTSSDRGSRPLQCFIWEGTDKRGIKLKGEQMARNVHLLRAELRKLGISANTIKSKPKPLFGAAGPSIKSKDIAFFSRQLATMMTSGVPIASSLEIIASGLKNPRMKKLVDTVRSDIEGGSSLYEAISQHPVQFDGLYRNLVRAGESAGVLETVLDSIASYKESMESLRSRIKKALVYPSAVMAVAFIVSAILLIFVVPQFEEVFSGFGVELPAFTHMIVQLSRFMVSSWWWLLIVVIGAVGGGAYTHNRSRTMQHHLDWLILKVPVIGQIVHKSAIARFARTTAVMFKAGVPLVDALGIVASATGNAVYEQSVLRMRDDVSVGYPVNMAMSQTNVFPHMVTQMTAIGEEAGALDAMLFKVAEHYELEVNHTIDALNSLLEPIIMVFVGTIVGGMVIGMYLPIFRLGAVVG